MQRAKSSKQTQAQIIKEVIAEFDIETQINKIAVRCFNDLLKSNKQAFEFISEYQQKLTEIQMRLTKNEAFTISIQSNISSKLQTTNALNRRLQTFNKEFFDSMKENEALITTMRKDYDSLINWSQKNTYQLRSNSDQLKKNATSISKMESSLDQNLYKITGDMRQNVLQLQKQIIENRVSTDKVATTLVQSKAQFLAKGSGFQEISKDMQLYKHQRMMLDRRIKDVLNQLDSKANKADVNQMRLMFDSQFTTEHEQNMNKFAEAYASIKQEISDRRKEIKKITDQSLKKWQSQQAKNRQTKNCLQQIKLQLKQKFEKLQTKHQKLETSLRTQIQALNKKEIKDIDQTHKLISQLRKKQETTNSSVSDIEKFQQARYEQLIQLTSTFNSVNQAVNNMIQDNNKRKRQLQKLQTQKSSVGDQVSSMNSVLDKIREEIVQNRRNFVSLRQMVQQLTKKQTNISLESVQMNKKWRQALQNQKAELQSKITETNRTINEVSIQIMKNLHKAEEQAKDYTDQLKSQIQGKLDFIQQVSRQMQILKKAFKQQTELTQEINRSISQKLERINTTLTKFKSDLTIKVDGVINQQQRRSFQIKQISKTLQELRKHISYQTQGLNIALSAAISKEYIQENLGPNQSIKISSLLEGWVLQLQQKSGKYRGQLIQRKRLLCMALNFLVCHGDKIKNALIQSGKEVYNKILEENQQIFTARKRGLSKKGGSELPKLFF